MFRSLSKLAQNEIFRNVCKRNVNNLAPNEFIEVNEIGGVREIVLNHEKTRNSLSNGMMQAIRCELLRDIVNEKLRCIVLSAKGKIWSAGHNLKEILADKNIAQPDAFQQLSKIILDIRKCPVPVIAKVNGYAAAGGCQLVSSCDIVVCSDTSKFSTPGVNLGIYCSTPGIAISRLMSNTKANYMLMTGLPISGEEAYAAGLVSKVVPADKIDEEVTVITNAIMKSSRSIITFGKKFYYEQQELSLEEAYKRGCETMATNLELSDCKEGIASFMEKRAPKWTHKNKI